MKATSSKKAPRFNDQLQLVACTLLILFGTPSARAGELLVADSRNYFRSLDTSTGVSRTLIQEKGQVRHLSYDASQKLYYYTVSGGNQFRYFLRGGLLTGDLEGYKAQGRAACASALHGGGASQGRCYYLMARNANTGALLWYDSNLAGTSREASGEIELIAAPGLAGPALGGAGDMTVDPTTGEGWFLTTDASLSTHLCTADLSQSPTRLREVRNLGGLHPSQQLSFDSAGVLWLSSADGHQLHSLSLVDGRILATLAMQGNVQVMDMAPGERRTSRSGKDAKNVLPVARTANDTAPEPPKESEIDSGGLYVLPPILLPGGTSIIRPLSPSCAVVR